MPKRGQMAYFARETLKIIYGAILVGCVTLLQENHKIYLLSSAKAKSRGKQNKVNPPPPPKSKTKQNKRKALNDKGIIKIIVWV